MGRHVALFAGFALVAAACGSSHEVVRIEATPAPTTTTVPGTSTTVASTTTSATTMPSTTVPSTTMPSTTVPSRTTTATAGATDPTTQHAEIITLLDRIGTADPFGPDDESYHFAAEVRLLDVNAPAPSNRADAEFVTVLSAVGDASPSAASFTVSDPESSVHGRIVDATVWMQRDDEWRQNEITDPTAEVVAVSYRNWTVFLVQMISLTARFADDTVMVSEPWEAGEHVTITATSHDDADPVLAAGLPIITELWVDEHGMLRAAEVQGFVLWSGTYLPAGMTIQIDRVPEPLIVAPAEELAESA